MSKKGNLYKKGEISKTGGSLKGGISKRPSLFIERIDEQQQQHLLFIHGKL